MIPDIAIIISTYAVARLLCEYVFTGDSAQAVRVIISILAVVVIGAFLAQVISTGSSLSGLNI